MPRRKAIDKDIAEAPAATREPAKAQARIRRQEQAGRSVAAGVASARTVAEAVQLTIFDYAFAIGVDLFAQKAARSASNPCRQREEKAS